MCKSEVSPDHERSSGVQEEPERPHTEEEELLQRPEEPAGSLLVEKSEVEDDDISSTGV